MNPVQNLYSALGQIIYGIAGANHPIQQDENDLLQKIIRSEMSKYKRRTGVDIILESGKRECKNIEKDYEHAINDMREYGHALNAEMKAVFTSIVKKVAAVFPPVTIERQNIADRFIRDINAIKSNHKPVPH